MGNLTIYRIMSYDQSKGGLNMRTLTMDTLMSYNKSKGDLNMITLTMGL